MARPPSTEAFNALPEYRKAGIRHLLSDMEEHGYSIRSLAEASGVLRSNISGIVNGRVWGRGETQVKIAEMLGGDPGLYFPRSPAELERAEMAAAGFCS